MRGASPLQDFAPQYRRDPTSARHRRATHEIFRGDASGAEIGLPDACVEKASRAVNIRVMNSALERMAEALVESGDYCVIRRLQPRTEYHPPDDNPKLIAAVVDVETTGTDPEHDKIIELGMCVFEYGRNDGRIYWVIGSWDWLEDPEIPIPPEITCLTGITDQMVAGKV